MLPSAARVVFTVRQVSPVCRVAARFVVRGHRGVNRIRSLGRRAGSCSPLALPHHGPRASRPVRQRVTVVVVGWDASSAQLAAARSANVCPSESTAIRAGSTGLAASGDVAGTLTQGGPGSLKPQSAGPNLNPGGVLGSSVEETARAIRPLLVGLLVFAILLLGIASLPRVATPESRASDIWQATGARSPDWAPPPSWRSSSRSSSAEPAD